MTEFHDDGTEKAPYDPEGNPRYLPGPADEPDPQEILARLDNLTRLDTTEAVLGMMETPGWAHFAATINAEMLAQTNRALDATDIHAVAEARGAVKLARWILNLQASQLVERDRLVELTRSPGVLDDEGEDVDHG